LDSAPATLNRVEPALGSDLRATMPTLHTVLRNVNPMLQYLKPYGRDIGSFFDTFAGSFDLLMGNGVRAVRLDPIFNQESVRNVPTPLLSNLNPQIWHNAYPKPGGAVRPEPFQGQYPRIHRDN
jgi:phospholipid/cholesterol/gamma-HCH transport system substrate-binding protein